ncbi:hypothetical protein TBLA_0D03320 [Henningerozyma blattae CBS 6284]|uniref:NADH:ubiquinone reductase (non-electrogenic) n=1 Tax=Henningerozyma blattae (strain ATCC 34711 / CBS 6284 / DSM 70876 / NBRC 10599 / NRRL Y-10934 / UCD 77-7) TaxID=1071380 RepID=I2H380_HENB6|nr:hypothetical protein TBLA_0D03320 [Tetrapisispora blattae CBS 6284]CCH60832.1 hypothetical protein TBLA_0D03320 [Tetrapisispora blattae CBS 6284]
MLHTNSPTLRAASYRAIRLASTATKASSSNSGSAPATASVTGDVSASATGSSSFRTTKIIEPLDSKPNIVILGSGWGAISFLKAIDTKKYNVSIVSPRNYFLFTPLLPSTPVGTVEEKSIIEPVVNFALKKKGNVSYYESEATEINPERNTVTLKSISSIAHLNTDEAASNSNIKHNQAAELKYDYLVSAVGAEPNTFGIPGVEKYGNFLKEIPDSLKVRERFAANLEMANLLPKGDPERKRLLSIVVVGGGPTGVETAGELQDYVHQDLQKFLPALAQEVQIHLVEALPSVLNMFEKKLSSYAQSVLEDSSMKLWLKTAVSKVEADHLVASTKLEDGTTKETTIPYGTLIWATGNKVRPVISSLFKKLPEQKDARRGLIVNEFLQVNGTRNVFAIGDNAFSGLPPTAQVAHQQADYLAQSFDRIAHLPEFQTELLEGSADSTTTATELFKKNSFRPFKYHHQGALAYLGAEKAIANIVLGGKSIYTGGGAFTFYIWRVTYLAMILSARSRFKVITDWLKLSFFKRDFFKGL